MTVEANAQQTGLGYLTKSVGLSIDTQFRLRYGASEVPRAKENGRAKNKNTVLITI